MRFKLAVALLGCMLGLLALAGCSSNSNNTTYIIQGTVESPPPTSSPVTTGNMSFYLNGSQVGGTLSTALLTTGVGVSNGTYTIAISTSLTNAATFFGPLAVNGNIAGLTIFAPTVLGQLYGNVQPPADPTTSTLEVLAVNSLGVPLQNASFTVTSPVVGSQPPPSSIPGGSPFLPAYVVMTGVTPSTNVSVTITTGTQAATISNVTFTAGYVVVVDAIMPGT